MDTLSITIITILATALVGAFIRGRVRDKCLKSFHNDPVTLCLTNGKQIWGKLTLESSGLELRYSKSHKDADGHLETSFLLYDFEYPILHTLIRFHKTLDTKAQTKREKELKIIYHPTTLRRNSRKVINFFKTVRDSILEIVNLALNTAKKSSVAGGLLQTQDKYVSQMKKDMFNVVTHAYEPLLENLIGKKVILEMDADGTVKECAGILKDYTANYIEIMDVMYALNEKSELEKVDLIVPRKFGLIRHMGE